MKEKKLEKDIVWQLGVSKLQDLIDVAWFVK